MLLNSLCDERSKDICDLVEYPLGALCFVIDGLNQGDSIEVVLKKLKQYKVTESSIKLVIENRQLLILLQNHHDDFKEIKDILKILYMMVFNSLPENIKEAV